MFSRLLYFRFVSTFRVGDILFWNLAFPILLSVFMFMAMSGIMYPQQMDPVPVQMDQAMVADIFEGIENEGNPMFSLVQTDDPEQALRDGTIAAYLPDEIPLRLVAMKTDTNTQIIGSILDTIEQRMRAVETVMGQDPAQDVQALVTQLNADQSVLVRPQESPKAMSTNYFYTVLAMVCLGAVSLGIANVYEIEARFSPMGKRLGIVPHPKLTFFLPYSVATLAVSLLIAVAVILFQRFVLGIPMGDDLAFLLLLVLVGSLLGLLIGMLISLIIPGDINARIGVGVGFYLFSSFLAGMMGDGIKYVVLQNWPIVHRLNPASLIAGSFSSMYYFETRTVALANIRVMLLECAVLAVLVILLARRNQYEYV